MSARPTPTAFDPAAPMPQGTTVIEASAGTGKTFTIATLVARYIAQGIPIERLLVVTFTRAATGELRQRIRERLVATERALDQHLRLHIPIAADDRLTAILAAGDLATQTLHRDRLRTAIGDIDAATIDTIHGFCREALGSIGFVGALDRATAFVDDLGALPRDVVDDLYLRRFGRAHPDSGPESEPLPFAVAQKVALDAIYDPTAPIVAGSQEPEAMRGRLAHAARNEIARRKQIAAVMTFDDLLLQLDAALSGDRCEITTARLRDRYDVALVDEFQDTDPTQWRIFNTLFTGEGRTLILIGDPKQAIYRFRGADVSTYLMAARTADEIRALDVNWRSDQSLLDAYAAIFRHARLGHREIVHQPVRAASRGALPRLRSSDGGTLPALRLRLVDRTLSSFDHTGSGLPRVSGVRAHVARDLAADVARVLEAGHMITGSDDSPPRPLVASDLAVLTRTNVLAGQLRDELSAIGVQAVLAGGKSVFATAAAHAWLDLLQALTATGGSVGTAALTPLIGWQADDLAAADGRLDALTADLARWGQLLAERGVANLWNALTEQTQIAARLLTVTGGERIYTDLAHLAELLHDAALRQRLTPTSLVRWLRTQIDDPGAAGQRARRLESDAHAVQVLTVHGSKGLEFPIVYCPSLWEGAWLDYPRRETVSFHDPQADDRRVLDVGGADRFSRAHRLDVAEQRGEELRLAYVALTRARYQAVIWWAAATTTATGALTRLIFGQADDGTVADRTDFPDDDLAYARFSALAADAAAASIAIERSGRSPTHSPQPPAHAPVTALHAARTARLLDDGWRRTSYSDITAAAGSTDSDESRAQPSDHAALPTGTQAGSLVHELLCRVDFSDPELTARLNHELMVREQHWGFKFDRPLRAAIAAQLAAAIATPFGRPLHSLRLADITRAERSDELRFELPLRPDAAGGGLKIAEIAQLLRRTAATDDPTAAYAERLADPNLRSGLHGYLTGSIDLVARVPASGGHRGYLICDYKTNFLGHSASDYAPGRVKAAMFDSHYVLQGLIYTVALHRLLRLRAPDYLPERDLLGVAYLFTRGMRGPATAIDAAGRRHGVFSWRPTPQLVTALSDLLDRSEP